jgi:beta-phosphoglucomutase-like phosphatase (HAD superfamily)
MTNLITPDTVEVFVDLDGVLVDFVKGTVNMFDVVLPDEDIEISQIKFETDPVYQTKMWDACWHFQENLGGELWYESPMMEDAKELWTYLEPYVPQILSATGPPKYKAEGQKRRWVAEQLGEHVIVNLTRKAAEKSQHAAPHRILIDDKPKAINPWVEKGGIGIVHTSAENTILELKKLGL